MKKTILLAVFMGLFLCAGQWLYADSVSLKSGKTYRGDITTHTDSELSLDTENGPVQIPLRMIKSIDLDAGEEISGYPLFDELNAKITQLREEEKKRDLVYKGAAEKVELYMTSWCPYCRKMEKFLQKNNIDYVRYNIEYDRAAYKRYKEIRGSGVPLLRIGNTIIRGYDPNGVLRALR